MKIREMTIFNNLSRSARISQLVLGVAVCLLMLATGCNQKRYKPANWRPAARDNSTLPSESERANGGIRWANAAGNSSNGTMPYRGTMPNRGTLPYRGTMPYRGMQSNQGTLPNRGGVGYGTLPGRGGYGQPGRGFPIQNGQRWSTFPSRGGIGNGTLPNRDVYPEYRTPQRNWSTLPSSSNWSPQRNFPLRDLGSTLPARNPLR